MLLNEVLAILLWSFFGTAVSQGLSSCVGCVRDENMLLQVVKEQDVASYHHPMQNQHSHPYYGRYGRHYGSYDRYHSWYYGRYGRYPSWYYGKYYGKYYAKYYGKYYGRKTTTVSTTAVSTTTTSTSTTRVVCTGGNANGGQGQLFFRQLDPPQNTLTIESTVASPECQCVGGTSGDTLVPGYLSVVASPLLELEEIQLISITSPNGTEMSVTAVPGSSGGALAAGTVAFNGFSAVGDWTIRLLDGDGNLTVQNASLMLLRFGLQPCNQILPAADCFGNSFDGKRAIFFNRSVVGTTLSSAETAVQFHADLPSECCLSNFSNSIRIQFSNTPPFGQPLSADGRSPDPNGVEFTLAGAVKANAGFREVLLTYQQPDVDGRNPAAGLWNFNISTAGFFAVIGNERIDPELLIRVQPCPWIS